MELTTIIDKKKWEAFVKKQQPLKIESSISTYNYWAPLTKSVEDLDKTCNCQIKSCILKRKENKENNKQMKVRFKEVELIKKQGNKVAEKWKRKLNNRRARKQENERMKREITLRKSPTGVMDSGATSSCGRLRDPFIKTGELSHKQFQVPTGQIVQATEQVKLFLDIREPARTVDLVPAMKTDTLISVGKFADAGYLTVFDEEEVNIYDGLKTKIEIKDEAIIRGWRDPETGLYRIPLKSKTDNWNTDTILLNKEGSKKITMNIPKASEEINNVYELPSTEKAIRFLHAAAGFPTKLTWLKAIRAGNYESWPMITVKNVNKYFPESKETQKGHMRQTREGVRSKKIKESNEENVPVTPVQKERDIMIKTYKMRELIATDQTGKFPITSSRGSKYIMVMCEIDGNAILIATMKNRTEGEMIKAYLSLIQRLKNAKIKPKHQILDNEALEEYKRIIKENGMTYQLVPPDMHRRNMAEKAIQTFKDHFVAILSGVDASFPMHLWDRLLPQTEMTLNLLRMSKVEPKTSAWAYLFGPHNYNSRPLAPLGCAVQVHEKPNKCKSWDPHSSDGWYIGTSDEHYRCFRIYKKETKTEIISDTVYFRHKYITTPTVTKADEVIRAARDLSKAIRTNSPSQSQATNYEDLKKISKIFDEVAQMKIPEDKWEEPAVARVLKQLQMEASHPRVQENVEVEELIVASPNGSKISNSLAPAYNTRAKARPMTITQESINFALEKSECKISPARLSSRKFPLKLLCEFAGAVMDNETGELMEYRHLMKNPKYREVWGKSSGNEIGRLAQGMPGRVEGTDTMFFIKKEEVPPDRFKDVTYGKFVVDYRENKEEKERVRLTVGGDRINYPDEVATPTADLLTVKLMINSVISTPHARWMTVDINFFT